MNSLMNRNCPDNIDCIKDPTTGKFLEASSFSAFKNPLKKHLMHNYSLM